MSSNWRPAAPRRPRSGVAASSSSSARPPRRPPIGNAPGATPGGSRAADDGASARRSTGGAATLVGNKIFRLSFLGLLVLVAFIVVFPTMRHYFTQRQEIAALQAQVTTAQQQASDIAAQLKRWDDPAYVEAQARSQLLYVLPGETAFRVVDPQAAQKVDPTPVPTASATPLTGLGTTGAKKGSTQVPWYQTLWESTNLAGSVPSGQSK